MLQVTGIKVAYGPVEAVKDVLVSHRRRVDRFADRTKWGGKEHDPECFERLAPVRSGSIVFDGRDITRMAPTKGLPGE